MKSRSVGPFSPQIDGKRIDAKEVEELIRRPSEEQAILMVKMYSW
jgi:hypothetical protein